MATKRTTKRTTSTTPTAPQTMGEGAVRDLVNQLLRDAFRLQSRELEQHLNDINDRLVALEKR
jgi:hypothetical protein